MQEYVQRFSDLLLKSSGLLPHQAIDLAHITHFICNLYNQKLQHYIKVQLCWVSPIKGVVAQVPPMDNSDSPSVVQQSQQGISFSCTSFIILLLWLCGVSYALCLLPSLLQCGLEIILLLGCSLGILLVS